MSHPRRYVRAAWLSAWCLLAAPAGAEECQPEILSASLGGGGSPTDVVVVGSTAYVATESPEPQGSGGFWTVDVSEPRRPTNLGFVPMRYPAARGLAVSGGRAYVAHWRSLQIIDIEDPESPTVIGSVETPGGAWGVSVSGGLAYVADGETGLVVIDVADPVAGEAESRIQWAADGGDDGILMTTKTLDEYIERTPGVAGGKARIAGHRITVADVAVWHERFGMSADEIATEYDLTLVEVYAALAYYFANRPEIDREIEEGVAFVEAMRRRIPSKVRQKLDAGGD